MSRRWAWISGWGIPPERFLEACERTYPSDTHKVFPPNRDAVDQALALQPDCIGAYSLGTLLLLCEQQRIPESVECILFAPILRFCQEDQCGGTTPRSSLQMLQRRLHEDPQKALSVFYYLAGLSDHMNGDLPYSHEDLIWGLEALDQRQAPMPDTRFRAIIGERDPLLLGLSVKTYFSNAQSVEAGHHYEDLLRQRIPQP